MTTPGPGVDGFSEREHHEDGPPLALGKVTGLRTFNFYGRDYSPGALGRADLTAVPAAAAVLSMQPGDLHGSHKVAWADGDNEARCIGYDGQPSQHVADGIPVPAPHPMCGCGFWVYWRPEQAYSVYTPEWPVLAIVDGWGRTRIGDKGFRSQFGRIVAMHIDLARARERSAASAISSGWIAAGGDWQRELDAFAVAADDPAMAAELENVLAGRYPSARIYSTKAAMLAKHPVSQEYAAHPNDRRHERWPAGPSGQCICQNCTQAAAQRGNLSPVLASLMVTMASQGMTVVEAARAITAAMENAGVGGLRPAWMPPPETAQPAWDGSRFQVLPSMPCVTCGRVAARVGQSLCDRCRSLTRSCDNCGTPIPSGYVCPPCGQRFQAAMDWAITHHPDGRRRVLGPGRVYYSGY